MAFYTYPHPGCTQEEAWQDARTRLSLNGFDPDAPCTPAGEQQWTPMGFACSKGWLNVAHYLFEHGAQDDIFAVNANSETVAWAACRGGNLAVLTWLYSKLCERHGQGELGAQQELRKISRDGLAPINLASANGKLLMVQWLVLHGALACDDYDDYYDVVDGDDFLSDDDSSEDDISENFEVFKTDDGGYDDEHDNALDEDQVGGEVGEEVEEDSICVSRAEADGEWRCALRSSVGGSGGGGIGTGERRNGKSSGDAGGGGGGSGGGSGRHCRRHDHPAGLLSSRGGGGGGSKRGKADATGVGGAVRGRKRWGGRGWGGRTDHSRVEHYANCNGLPGGLTSVQLPIMLAWAREVIELRRVLCVTLLTGALGSGSISGGGNDGRSSSDSGSGGSAVAVCDSFGGGGSGSRGGWSRSSLHSFSWEESVASSAEEGKHATRRAQRKEGEEEEDDVEKERDKLFLEWPSPLSLAPSSSSPSSSSQWMHSSPLSGTPWELLHEDEAVGRSAHDEEKEAQQTHQKKNGNQAVPRQNDDNIESAAYAEATTDAASTDLFDEREVGHYALLPGKVGGAKHEKGNNVSSNMVAASTTATATTEDTAPLAAPIAAAAAAATTPPLMLSPTPPPPSLPLPSMYTSLSSWPSFPKSPQSAEEDDAEESNASLPVESSLAAEGWTTKTKTKTAHPDDDGNGGSCFGIPKEEDLDANRQHDDDQISSPCSPSSSLAPTSTTSSSSKSSSRSRKSSGSRSTRSRSNSDNSAPNADAAAISNGTNSPGAAAITSCFSFGGFVGNQTGGPAGIGTDRLIGDGSGGDGSSKSMMTTTARTIAPRSKSSHYHHYYHGHHHDHNHTDEERCEKEGKGSLRPPPPALPPPPIVRGLGGCPGVRELVGDFVGVEKGRRLRFVIGFEQHLSAFLDEENGYGSGGSFDECIASFAAVCGGCGSSMLPPPPPPWGSRALVLHASGRDSVVVATVNQRRPTSEGDDGGGGGGGGSRVGGGGGSTRDDQGNTIRRTRRRAHASPRAVLASMEYPTALHTTVGAIMGGAQNHGRVGEGGAVMDGGVDRGDCGLCSPAFFVDTGFVSCSIC